MTVSVLDLEKTLTRIRLFTDELASLLEERHLMVSLLQLTPSANDNYDVINSLEKIQRVLQYFEEDFAEAVKSGKVKGTVYNNLRTQFQAAVALYKSYTDKLYSDEFINISEYLFVAKPLEEEPQPVSLKSLAKLVRFRDNPIEEEQQQDAARDQLFGTSFDKQHKPYRDDDTASNASSFDAQSNQQIFAQHQQQIIQQDNRLESLHDSVVRQHQMGLGIQEEIDDHLILLNDLERGVDSSYARLQTAQGRLKSFLKMCRENGSLVTIIILTIILITLLVVLN